MHGVLSLHHAQRRESDTNVHKVGLGRHHFVNVLIGLRGFVAATSLRVGFGSAEKPAKDPATDKMTSTATRTAAPASLRCILRAFMIHPPLV
jgi:hypothetical protein